MLAFELCGYNSQDGPFPLWSGGHDAHSFQKQFEMWTRQTTEHFSTWQQSIYWCLHICEGTINVKKYILILEKHMMPSKRRLFHGRPCLFQVDNAKPHSARVTTAWLHSKRVRELDWPACSPDLSPIENVWRIMKRKIAQRRPRTVEQLKLYIKQEWERIPPENLQKLVSSVPKCLLNVIKRKGDVTKW